MAGWRSIPRTNNFGLRRPVRWHDGFGASAVTPYTRAALFLIRLIAAGFVICSLCLYSSDLFLWLSHHPPHRLGWLALKAVPLLIGLAIYWKSEDIAKQLTKDLD